MYRKGNYKYAELPEYDAKCIELPYAVISLSQIFEKKKSSQMFEFFSSSQQCAFHFDPSRISLSSLIFIIAEQGCQHGDHPT